MSGIMDWIKEHPYMTGGVVLLLFVLYILYRNSQSAAATAPASTAVPGQSDAITALQIQAGAQLGAAQIASQTQIAGYQTQQNVTQLNTAAATSVYSQQTAAQLTEDLAAVGAQNYQTSAALQLGLAQLGVTPASTSTPPTGGTSPVMVGGLGNGGTMAGGFGSNPPTAPINTPGALTEIPAGEYTLSNPLGSFSSAAGVLPAITGNESYDQYRQAVATANGQTACSPYDSQCIANATGQEVAANQAWTAYQYGGAPVPTPAPTNYSPSLSGTCAERAGGPAACVNGV